jgi:apolipoprotein N-acyltransferase
MKPFLDMWWISWFGFIGVFFFIGGMELKREFSNDSTAIYFSLALFITISLSWIVFFIADTRLKERDPAPVKLLTLMGTILTLFTLIGIGYFAFIAPHAQ